MNAIAVDPNGNIYLAGDTNSDQFPITGDATQPNRAGYADATLSVMDTNGTRLYFSTFYGGLTGDDIFYGIAVDSGYNVYLTGSTSSGDLPILNAVQSGFGGGDPNGSYSDALLAKISLYVSNVPGAGSGHGPPNRTVSRCLRSLPRQYSGALTKSRCGTQWSAAVGKSRECIGRSTGLSRTNS